jgi:hypothetical protein
MLMDNLTGLNTRTFKHASSYTESQPHHNKYFHKLSDLLIISNLPGLLEVFNILNSEKNDSNEFSAWNRFMHTDIFV